MNHNGRSHWSWHWILAKEQELWEFFDKMERNKLRHYMMGDYYDRAKGGDCDDGGGSVTQIIYNSGLYIICVYE